jgi:hypothetical protein
MGAARRVQPSHPDRARAAGGIVGGGLGMGAVSAAQELAPAYAQARQEGLDHDGAVDRAIKTAAVSGVLGAATYPLFELGPFKGSSPNICSTAS